MKFHLPPIYPITDVRSSGLTHAEQVRLLCSAGAGLVQAREKTASSGEFLWAAREAVTAAHAAGSRLIVNDRVDVALLSGADGVHLGQDDLSPAAARKILGGDSIIGLSTHSIEQVSRALAEPVDYIAFGPIFPTATKKDPDPTVGTEGLAEVRKMIGTLPLVAIGGIDRSNAGSVFAAGADSVAVISDLWSSPAAAAERYRELAALYR